MKYISIDKLEDYLKIKNMDKCIYRYRPIIGFNDEHTVENKKRIKDLIKYNRLYFASAKEFVDPTDGKLSMSSDLVNEDQIRGAFKKSGINYNENVIQNVISYFQSHKEEWAKLANNSFDEHHIWGYCCFTTRWNNKLVWEHYTRFKGIALKFDILKDEKYFGSIMPMTYSDVIPSIDFTEEYSLLKGLTTKGSDYVKEEEIRFVKNHKGTFKFIKHSLVEIIFGCYMNEEDIKWIINLCKTYHYSHVKFKKLTIVNSQLTLAEIK